MNSFPANDEVLLDTNVLIGFFRHPGEREKFDAQMSRPLLFMSSIVALELFAAAGLHAK